MLFSIDAWASPPPPLSLGYDFNLEMEGMQTLAVIDINKDKAISLKEAEAFDATPLIENFDAIDIDSNGMLEFEEIDEFGQDNMRMLYGAKPDNVF